jgi:hypothetical protein
MALIAGFPQGLLNNIIGAAPQQAVAAPVQAPPPASDTNKNEFTFDAVGYLQQNPDIAQAAPWLADNKYEAYRHYQEYGKNEGRPANFFDPKTPTTPDRWVGVNLSTDPENPITAFQDPATKEVYSSQTLDSLIPGGKTAVLSQQAKELSETIFTNWSQNRNGQNYFLSKDLEAIKQYAPEAYYPAEFNLLSKQSGWQHGQNTFDRAKPYQERIESLVPDALKAGLTPDQINSLVGGGFSAASTQNQQRIINEQQSGGGGFNLGELIRGVAPIAAFAIGAPFLDAALAGGAAAAAGGGAAGGTATGTGLTGGFGGSTGLLGGTGAAGFGGAGSAAGIAGTQAAAGLGVAAGSALPAAGMAVGGLPSTVGQFSAALPAQGSVGGAGLLSAELAPGTILGSGLPGGGAIGASYALGANGLPATGLLGQPIPASSIGFGGIPETVTSGLSIGIKDALNVARLGSGLIGGAAQPTPQAAAPQPQNIVPRGQVDYSGILNLLQVPSPQRNMYSLLG